MVVDRPIGFQDGCGSPSNFPPSSRSVEIRTDPPSRLAQICIDFQDLPIEFQYDRGSPDRVPGGYIHLEIDTLWRWISDFVFPGRRIRDLDLVSKLDQPGSFIDRRSTIDQNAIKFSPD